MASNTTPVQLLATYSIRFINNTYDRFMNTEPQENDKKGVNKNNKNKDSKDFERLMAWIQGLLVWDEPSKSIVALAVFNVSFWVLVWIRRPISIVFFISFIGYLVKTWKTKIWPEIRGKVDTTCLCFIWFFLYFFQSHPHKTSWKGKSKYH